MKKRQLPHPSTVYLVIAVAVLLSLTIFTPANINAAVTAVTRGSGDGSAISGAVTLDDADAKCTAGCQSKGLGFAKGICDTGCVQGETAYPNSAACLGTDYPTCCCSGETTPTTQITTIDEKMKPYDEMCKTECTSQGFSHGICDNTIYEGDTPLNGSVACSGTDYPKCICYNGISGTASSDYELQQADAGCKQECDSKGLSYTNAICDSGCLENEDEYSSISCAKTQYPKCCCGPKSEEKQEWKVCTTYDESIDNYIYYCSPTCEGSIDTGDSLNSFEECISATEYANQIRQRSVIFVANKPSKFKCQEMNDLGQFNCLLGDCYYGEFKGIPASIVIEEIPTKEMCYPCGSGCSIYTPYDEKKWEEYSSYKLRYDMEWGRRNCELNPCNIMVGCRWDTIHNKCIPKTSSISLDCSDCGINGKCTEDKCKSLSNPFTGKKCFSRIDRVLFSSIVLCDFCNRGCDKYNAALYAESGAGLLHNPHSKETCQNDPCGFKNCYWDPTANKCVSLTSA